MSNDKQPEIDWTAAVHNQENNKFSQKNLDKHRHKFTGQAAYVETALRQGKRLNSDYAREIYHIKHLARRIGDIGEKLGIYIDREWGLDKDLEQEDELVYFLPENRQLFIQKKWIIDRPRWWYSKVYTPTDIINEIKNQQKKQC
jgi:hypothetical protein